jgi:hypothetical protein
VRLLGGVLGPLEREQQDQLLRLLQRLTGELEDDARAAFVPPRES